MLLKRDTEFGIKESDIDSLSEAASKVTRLLNNNPRKVELEDIKDMYRKAMG